MRLKVDVLCGRVCQNDRIKTILRQDQDVVMFLKFAFCVGGVQKSWILMLIRSQDPPARFEVLCARGRKLCGRGALKSFSDVSGAANGVKEARLTLAPYVSRAANCVPKRIDSARDRAHSHAMVSQREPIPAHEDARYRAGKFLN